ncbi:MAG: hypothetical protein HS103_05620 [Anaerolineales bacterium]|nr:hypothetical protein [Anaerolineales bacterium]
MSQRHQESIKSDPTTPQRIDRRLTVFLAAVLLGVYLFVYIPLPDSADGKAILAVSSSIVQQGRFDINVIGASDSLLPRLARLGAVGVDGALYAKKGITPSLALLPFVAAAVILPGASIRAVAMLLNPFVTALTALILYAFLRRLGFRPRTGLIVALIYGVGTLALPYVKTLYGEPLTAFLLLGGVYAAHRWRVEQHRPSLTVAAGAFALAVGVNTIYVILLPILTLYCFKGRFPPRRAWLAFAVPILIVAGGLAAYNLARFGSPLSSGYHFGEGEGFIHPLPVGFLALWVSPWRGVFFYSPVLLLALPGWLRLRRSTSPLALLLAALVIGQAASFASWWSWHGGITWGTRFLIPALPLMALCLAPLVEAAAKQAFIAAALIILTLISVSVQALGALYSYFPYEMYLARTYGANDIRTLASGLREEVVWRLDLSPIGGHLALLWGGYRPFEPAVLTGNLAPAGMEQANAAAAALTPAGVTVAATTLFEDALLDIHNGSRVITMNAPTTPDDPDAQAVWRYALRQAAEGQPFWFVTWFGAADPANWQERWLWENAAFVSERFAAGHRLLWFDLGTALKAETSGGWRFGQSQRLDRYGVRVSAAGVYLTLAWSTDTPIPENNGWFVHLLTPAGEIAAQQDRQPLGGYRPTTTWEVGEAITDRLFFPVGGVGKGWRLRIGLPDGAGGLRPITAPDGGALAERFLVIDLE